MYVLLVEDDPRVARVVTRALTEAGHRVDHAADGVEGLARAERGVYDLIVLDVLLPGLDGIELCRMLRRLQVHTPILMLTARDAVSDRVRGLDAGADDYLVKPFALQELLARVRALGRRGREGAEDGVLRVGDLALDPSRREVCRGDQTIDLTPREFDLLHYLMQHPARVLTKDRIADYVWGFGSDVTANVVETYVHYLRNKIDRGSARPLLRTVRGAGYMLRDES